MSPGLSRGELDGPVLVVGAGLLGTSVGLALSVHDVPVLLSDISDEHVRTATGLGAGVASDGTTEPQLVVVAVPPDHLATAIVDALRSTCGVVTDVGSVKGGPLAEVASRVTPEELRRYVGSHPMAGSERSGPLAASSVLFDGRPWAIAPHATAEPRAVSLVTSLALACGGTPIMFDPEEHDRAVARTSHLPHVVSAVVASVLADAPQQHLALTGQGLRDVTRIAAGDPGLWEQILSANTGAVGDLLREVRGGIDELLTALESGSRPALHGILDRGVAGTAVIPGKHGGAAVEETAVYVVVPDVPGELARLFADVGEIDVNVEDVRIDHDLGRPYGVVELTVAGERVEHLLASLADRGWTAHR